MDFDVLHEKFIELQKEHIRNQANLHERNKELQCLLTVAKLVNRENNIDYLCKSICRVLPAGFQFDDFISVRIVCDDKIFTSDNFIESGNVLNYEFSSESAIKGAIQIHSTLDSFSDGEQFFLQEEHSLVASVAMLLEKFFSLSLSNNLPNSNGFDFASFDALDDMVFLADPGAFSVLNANKYGLSELGSGVFNQKCFLGLHGLDSPCSHCQDLANLKNIGTISYEFLHAKTGRWLRSRRKIIELKNNAPVCLIHITDVSDKKNLERQLTQGDVS